MSHTPGPWTWFNYPDGRKLLCGPDRAVIHCPDAVFTCEPPDAQLIAAAPDLLAVVKKLRHVVEAQGLDPVDGNFRSIIEQADDAITKAEGR